MTGLDLRAIRERHCMTQAEFAEAIGRSANTVARYERGEMTIPAIVEKLVKALDG
jgi:transcriptional regulator with XRE-family HTH domain